MRPFYGLDYIFMALATRLFCDLAIMRLDSQRLWKSPRSECERVPESIRRFSGILCYKPRRSMAIIAGCDRAMTRLYPPVIVLLHDVTVGARSGVVCQVRSPFRVDEGVAADTGSKANRNPKHDSRK